MNRKKITTVILAFAFLISIVNGFLPSVSAGIKTAFMIFLPIVFQQPTPTITPNPTPIPTIALTPTPRPTLQDGYYQADLPYNGQIWFTVSNNGTKAKNGGFIFKTTPWCSWGIYSFDSSVSIDNGDFGFIVIDQLNHALIASLGCSSESSDSASCSALKPNYSNSNCSGISGIATLR